MTIIPDNLIKTDPQKSMVSIQMITYNHEKYIAQAIEGVINQKTTFPIELVIGEDCSTDSTRQICVDYANRYKGIIKLLPSEENLGVCKNSLRTLNECNGDYIALCEGDDYWTDPLKLLKQVDFLESNPDFAGSFHQTKVILENGSERGDIYGLCDKDYLTAVDTISATSPFHTSSFVFRNYELVLPEWFYNVVSADMALFSILSSYGPIKNLPEVMSVYRKHEGGITNTEFFKKTYHQKRIELISNLDSLHDYRFHDKALGVIEYHKKEITKTKIAQRFLYSGMHTNFINPVLTKANLDTYCINSAIFNFVKNHLNLLKGKLLGVSRGSMPYRDYLSSSSDIESYIGLELEQPLNYGDIKPDFYWGGKRMPFDDDYFSCALLAKVLEHAPSPECTLSEIYRVLKPESVLIGTVPFIWPLHEVSHDEYRYTPFAVERILKECNFREIQIRALGGWNASLAQFLGLWVERSMISKQKRRVLRVIVKIMIKFLLKRDLPQSVFSENIMISGLGFIAKK